MGVKPRPRPVPAGSAALAASGPASKPAADTILLYRRILTIPAKQGGRYLGTLEGVRCFNCAPDLVLLNLGDSVSRQAAVVAMRIEAWNAVERPLKDRRMFDHENKCFFFGFKEIDTAFVGGEWTEIRVQDVSCYPYVRRTLAVPLGETPRPVEATPATQPRKDGGPESTATATPPDKATAPAGAASAIATAPEAESAPAPAPARAAAPAQPPIDVVLEPTID